MKWPLKKTAKVGDQRWNIKFAWLPTKAYKPNSNNCTELDPYIVWLEYYDCHEVYKTMLVSCDHGNRYQSEWVLEKNYVLEPLVK